MSNFSSSYFPLRGPQGPQGLPGAGGAQGIPGNPGAQGAPGTPGTPGVDATIQTVATTSVAWSAAQPDPDQPSKVRAAVDLKNGRFAGVFTASGGVGTEQPIQHAGPIGSIYLSLGEGPRTAVGANSDGVPVRVTDPTCASGLNFLGWCDEAGTVTVSPRVADTYDPRDFGAVPNDPTSDLALALRTIIARMPTLGGQILIPDGDWYLLTSEPALPGLHVYVDKAVQFVGSNGFSPFDFNCRIIAQPGRTALRFAYGSGNSLVSRIGLSTTGKLTTTSTVANYTPNAGAPPNIITVSPGHDFIVGQVACLPGAAAARALTSTTGSVTSGTKTVTLVAAIFGTLPGIRANDWIILGTAYPTPARVASISLDGLTLTMRDNAAATVTDAQVYLCPEMHFRITAVAGNDLTVDNHNGDGNALVGATLEHADAAIDLQSLVRIESVCVGNYSVPTSFAGAAILMLADHGFTPVSNCNLSSVSGVYVFGARHGLFAYGVDAHRCDIVGLKCAQTTSWAVLDLSGYGNDYFTLHVDGGKGIVTADVGNQAAFYGPYSEGGTVYYFGNGTTVYGGTLNAGTGGRMTKATVESGFTLSRPDSTYRTDYDPDLSWAQYFNEDSAFGGGIQLLDPNDGTNDQNFLRWRQSGNAGSSLAIANAGARWRAGTVWIPRGFVIGTAANNTDQPTSAITMYIGVEPPDGTNQRESGRRNADGSVDGTWHVGDMIINSSPSAGGPGAWQCTTAGTYSTSVWKVSWTVAP